MEDFIQDFFIIRIRIVWGLRFMNKNRAVCYITDEKYAMPTCVSMTSLKVNNDVSYPINVYVLCDNVSQKSKAYFSNLCDDFFRIKIIYIDTSKYDGVASELIGRTYVSRCALAKFQIPLLVEDLDRILYIDGDIIVNNRIDELWDLDISQFDLAASDDMGDGIFCEGHAPRLAQRIGLEIDEYFNSGVMFLNLKRLRENRVPEKLIEYRLNGNNYFMDQDAFNACLYKTRFSLSNVFNFRMSLVYQMSFDEVNRIFYSSKYSSWPDCIRDQKIIHMTSSYKPWEYLIPFFSDIYDKYYYDSPYKEHVLERKDLLPVLFNQVLHVLDEQRKCMDERKMLMQWKFPFDKVEKGSSIVIYGAGEVGNCFVDLINNTQYCHVVLWVDKDYKHKSEDVFSVERIMEVDYDYILIALSKEDVVSEVKKELVGKGIDIQKIVALF